MSMKMSILSERNARPDNIPKLGGKIRPGIKVLTTAARGNSTAVSIYNEGVAKRLKFSEIEKQIKAAVDIKNPMYPRNTPYFSLAASDFGMPEIADRIMHLYGEVRDGDPNRRLYRFPVVFHSDDLNEVYPNGFKSYGAEPHYESHYADDGQRLCRYLPKITPETMKEQKAARMKRMPRREKVVRGACNPATCQEFGQGLCKFRGRLQFYIPGAPTGLLGMETSSEYAAEAIFGELAEIVRKFGGIPRFNPNKIGSPIFYIAKVQQQRSYVDEDGVKQTGQQWVPVLQADIDLGTLMLTSAAPQISEAPIAWLNPPKSKTEALAMSSEAETKHSVDADGVVTDVKNEEQKQEAKSPDDLMEILQSLMVQFDLSDEDVADYFDSKMGDTWQDDALLLQQGIDQLNKLAIPGGKAAKHFVEIAAMTIRHKIDQKLYGKYTVQKYGKGFTSNPSLLHAAHHELTALIESPVETIHEYLNAELCSVV